MSDQHEQQRASPPSPAQSDSLSELDGRYLRAGLSAFIVVCVVALTSLRAADYWDRTHGPHAVPVVASDALSSYLPAAVVYVAVVAGAVYWAVSRRRRVSSATNRS